MGQNGLFHASSGSQIHLLTTVHPEIASRGSQWPVRRAGVPGEGAVTTVTAWPTVTRVREVRDQPTNPGRRGPWCCQHCINEFIMNFCVTSVVRNADEALIAPRRRSHGQAGSRARLVGRAACARDQETQSSSPRTPRSPLTTPSSPRIFTSSGDEFDTYRCNVLCT